MGNKCILRGRTQRWSEEREEKGTNEKGESGKIGGHIRRCCGHA